MYDKYLFHYLQLSLPTVKTPTFSSTKRGREKAIKKECQESSDNEQVNKQSPKKKRPESYKVKMARIKREKAAKKKKLEAGKGKAVKKKTQNKGSQDMSGNEEDGDSFPYSEIKEIIAASKKADQKGKASKIGKERKEEVVETPVKYSSRGRAITPKQHTPIVKRTNNAASPAGKTPKVVLKGNKVGVKSSSTPGRYSTRGTRVDYQKMNSGQVEVKEEIISDEDVENDAMDNLDNSEIENSKTEGHEEKPKRKRGRPRKETKEQTKRASIMVNPITDSEMSEHENERNITGSDNDLETSFDDSKMNNEISDDDDDYISDLDEDVSKSQDDNENESGDKIEGTETLDTDETDSGVKQSDNKPKVTVQLISQGSPVKIGSAASNIEKTPSHSVKQVMQVSPKKITSENLEDHGKELKNKKGIKVVACVPMVDNKDARKVIIRSRKRPANDNRENDVIKMRKVEDTTSEILEMDYNNVENEDEENLSTKIIAIPSKDNSKCSLCDFEAETFSGLTDHLIQEHSIVDPPRCDICEIDFASAQQVRAHLESSHGPQQEVKKYKCGACESIFSTRKQCELHISLVHIKKNETELKPSRKGLKYSCEKCEFFTSAASDFHDHMKLKHDIDIVCEICSKTYSNMANLKMHQESVHFKNKMAACEICDKQFNHIRYLKAHMESHKSEGRFECSQCHRKFNTKASLINHIETHKAPDDRDYKYVCNYCGKKYLYKSNYEDHLNKHTGAKPHVCKTCNKSFGFRSMLLKHKIYVHQQERPFYCTQCRKSFKFERLLRNHMTIHTLQSQHVCSKCSKHFTTKSTLKVHEQKCMGITKQVQPVSKASTLILHIDGKPTLYHLGVGNDQVVTSGAENMVDTIISIPEQPVVQEQALTDILIDQTAPVFNEQTPSVFTQQTTPDLPQQTFMAPPLINDTPPAVGGLLTGSQDALGQVDMTVKTELAVPEQTKSAEVYVCSECESAFASFDEAQSHILTVHS